MATRLYLPSTGVPPVSPAFDFQDSWDDTESADRILAVASPSGSPFDVRYASKADDANVRRLMRQYVTPPLAPQSYPASSFRGVARFFQQDAANNIDQVFIKIVVVSEDGVDYRGAILSLSSYAAPLAWDTAFQSRVFTTGQSTASVGIQARDRILIEIGYSNTSPGTDIVGFADFGDASPSDLPLDDVAIDQFNPWIELFDDLSFVIEIAASARGTGTLACTLSVDPGFPAAMVGTGTLGAVLVVDPALSADIEGTGTLDAVLRVMSMDDRLRAIEQAIEALQANVISLVAADAAESATRSIQVSTIDRELTIIKSMVRR